MSQDLTYANTSSAKSKLDLYEITLLCLDDLLSTKDPSDELNAQCCSMIDTALTNMAPERREELVDRIARQVIADEDEAEERATDPVRKAAQRLVDLRIGLMGNSLCCLPDNPTTRAALAGLVAALAAEG